MAQHCVSEPLLSSQKATIDVYCQWLLRFFFIILALFLQEYVSCECAWTTVCDKACNTLDEIFSSSEPNFPVSPRRRLADSEGRSGWKKGLLIKKKGNLILQLTLHIDFNVMTTWVNTCTNSLRWESEVAGKFVFGRRRRKKGGKKSVSSLIDIC